MQSGWIRGGHVDVDYPAAAGSERGGP
jgi:hypothetical protein